MDTPPRLHVCTSIEETAKRTALAITTHVTQNPSLAITYATGNTMIPVYEEVARQVEDGKVDFSHTLAFHLDEYYPCSPTESFSFVRYVQERVCKPFGIPVEARHILDGQAKDAEAEANRYDQLVTAHPGLVLLGIGPGGHIGFNERHTPFESRTHVAKLAEETVKRDRGDRGQKTPDSALTQGIANILEAKSIILTTFGAEKGVYLKEAFTGPISPVCPASALRLVGDKVTMIIDQDAANNYLV